MKYLRTRKIIKAGRPGTLKYQRIYGEDLVCVRYRYNYKTLQSIKTIELVVDKTEWRPNSKDRFYNQLVKVKILINETELRKAVKKYNGKWDAKEKVWHLPLKTVIKLKLEHRIIK